MNRNKILKCLTVLVTVFISGFIILSVLIHIINPGLNVLSFPLSLYRYSSHGYLVSISIIMIGIAELILGYLFYIVLHKKNKALSILLILMGVSAIMIGIFPMDIKPNRSVQGFIHNLAAGFQFFTFPAISMIFGLSAIKKDLRIITLILGVTAIFLLPFITFTVLSETPLILPVYGLLQKIYISLIVIWLYVITYSVSHHEY